MLSQSTKIIQLLAFILVISISTIFAGGPRQLSGEESSSEFGVLQSKSAVLINGNKAEDGITVLSNSQIKTSNRSAIIRIPQIGVIDIHPKSNATINFTKDNITVDLKAGKVKLNVFNKVSGKIISNEGEVTEVTSNLPRVAPKQDDDDYRDANGKCIDADNDGKLECDDDGVGAIVWWGVGGIIAATTIILVATRTNDGDNTIVASPVRP